MEDLQKSDRDFKTAKLLYANVQAEYLSWKAKDIAETWSRVFPESTTNIVALERFRLPANTYDPAPNPPIKPGESEDKCLFSWTYDEDGNIGPGERIPLVVVKPTEFATFPPHPPYQFVTPASRNMNARMIDIKTAPFIPFPADPEFPREQYLSSFEDVQWRSDQRDADEEVIQYETVRRLHVEHGLSAEDLNIVIQNLAATTFFRELRLSNASGLLWDVSQRDLPDVIWGDGVPSSRKTPLPPHFAQAFPTPNDVFAHVNKGRTTFCFNLSCLHHYCHVHVSPEWDMHTPAVSPKDPHLTSEQFFEQSGDPCGEDCFLLINPDDMEDDADDICFLVIWPSSASSDADRYSSIGDSSSMTETFCHLKITIPLVLVKRNAEKTRRRRKRRTRISPFDLIVTPCDHPGPCTSRVNCECFRAKSFCEQNCRCSPTCERRWMGCNATCSKPNWRGRYTHCQSGSKCACRVMNRECEVDLCTSCDARDEHVHYPEAGGPGPAAPCQNMDLQRGEFKCFEIRRSQYGLGAFASENIRAGDVIGEYIGELVGEHDANINAAEILHKHAKLNYEYGIGFSICDAQWLGNPTRFLNDAMPGVPNCQTDGEHTVNGEKRLLIYATKNIKKGGELTLAYGEAYWEAHNAPVTWKKTTGH
ncbi:hypothetical protein DFH07DRAFT_77847 [Mycena maculata]|uniref:SET domain-containing protein n=1 Tax=Mycena maculata TaxID=230809 RepID=A0AAD7IC10_9AGAR|nr:hypothetical protein DFH07DRAFT_77847 [Mycena maculata]